MSLGLHTNFYMVSYFSEKKPNEQLCQFHLHLGSHK